ncbi:pyrroline-5-carboxylate reductase [Turicibacter sanguinis]|uniref:pyrroline-5-carboxylate reductase n=1 Tax=Turicibacter sanguinis TaxID=154288 RepID=UPI0018AA2B19|nr:pyrroline-5-carboxylate reductase [Turicibacter sanguinis]MDB8553675.1 pyrroline-5-carboxylate reductase [Turicibacter sanguinis]
MKYPVGFIGSGNMAMAMLKGLLKSELILSNDILMSNPSQTKVNRFVEDYKINGTTSNQDVANLCQIVILAVKPYLYPAIIDEIKESIHKETIIVSIAAGPTLQMIEDYFQKSIKVVRTMPNTPAQVGEAMSAIIPNRNVTENELNQVIAIFNSFGKCEVVSEVLIDSVIAVSGSSPAYVYMMIESMADAAVLQGMPRNLAYEFAAQAVLGAAKMVLETGMHPGGLKDQVCSPGGTTIEAVAKLEQEGFRASIMNAMEACAKKSKKMSK